MTLWKMCGTVLVSTALLQSASGTTDGRPTDIAVKDRANAFASIAASSRFVAIAWGATKDGATDVYAAVSHDAGRHFAAPARVNGASGPANLSGEQPPRIALVHREQAPGTPRIAIARGTLNSAGVVQLVR